jgi:hypothetical protein
MIQTIKNQIEQDKKGCGIEFIPTGYDVRYKAECKKNNLCPTCQARLEAHQSDLILAEEEDKKNKAKFEKFVGELKDRIWKIDLKTAGMRNRLPSMILGDIEGIIDTLANNNSQDFKLDESQAPKKVQQVDVIATGNLGDVSGCPDTQINNQRLASLSGINPYALQKVGSPDLECEWEDEVEEKCHFERHGKHEVLNNG